MAHALRLTDEQYARLELAAHLTQQTPEQMLADWLEELPDRQPVLPADEYERRWEAFLTLSGSITLNHPVSLDDIDEILTDEYMDTHESELK
jgi:hypothetical protein